MTIMGAINHIDAVKPNGYTQDDKIRWLSILDGTVKTEIIDTHEGSESVTFRPYSESTPLVTELLIPYPYDDVYIKWLEAQIDYSNGEYDKYNNAIVMYQTAYDGYANYYRRTHMPRGTAIKYF